MKRHALAVTALFTLAAPVLARDYVVALPDTLQRATAEIVYRSVEQLALSVAQPGESIIVLRAATAQTVAEFAIPEGPDGEHAQRRARLLQPPLAQFGAFVKSMYLDMPGAGQHGIDIRFPALLGAVGNQLFGGAAVAGRDLCVLVAGSGLYQDPREPQFDMTGARYPADGLIVASQAASIYGTADRQGDLAGIYVHYLWLDDEWASDVHQLKVERAWYLFVEAQGGTLASFSGDPAAVVGSFLDCDRKAGRDFGYDSTRSVQAMLVTERSAAPPPPPEPVGDPDPAPCTLTGNDDWLCAPSVEAVQTSPAQRSGAFKIGIRWGDAGQCAASDIDLYVRSSSAMPWLFFGHDRSDDGHYFKDYRSAPEAANGLEYVEVTRQAALADMQVWINYYEGSCPGGVQGTVRAYFDGQIYELPYLLKAERGNRGNMMGENDHWVRVDMADLFNF